jgi:hypothetical protein
VKINTSLFAAVLILTGQALALAQTNQNAVAVVGDIYGVHCTSYTYQESQDYLVDWGTATEHDDSFIFWQNGVGGLAFLENIYILGIPNVLMWETTSWPAGSWPNPLPPGTYTQFWHGIYPETNAITHRTVGGGADGVQIGATAISPRTGSSFTWYNLSGMTLTTGGQAGSTAKNLFEISATALTQTNAEPPNPDHVPWLPDSTYAGVPYDQITVDSFGQLDSDGTAYAVLPDNKDVIANAHIKGKDKNTYHLTPGKYHLTSWTHYPALTDTNRARLNLGVGEEVDLSGMPGKTIWTASAGAISTNNGTITFTAPSNAPPGGLTATVTATVGNASLPILFTVFPPSGIDHAVITSIYPNSFSLGNSGAKMDLNVYVAPTSVSFYRVSIMEVPGPATNTTGAFTNSAPYHSTAGFWFPLTWDNLFGDGAGRRPPGRPAPFIPSGFDWNIPSKWQVTGSSTTNNFTYWIQSIRILNEQGDCSVSKFGQTIMRTTNNVITTN